MGEHIDTQLPLISIVIVSWNAKKYMADCLDSIYALDDCHKEVVVVDNGSTDGSCELIETLYSEVKLIKNEANLGFSAANNIGIKACSGDYICLVNSDITIFKNCFRNMVSYLEAHPHVGLAGPRILNMDGTLQVSCRQFPSLWNTFCNVFALHRLFPRSEIFSDWFMNYWAHDEVRDVAVLSGCFWVARKKAIEDVGVLDESFFFYGEDIDWCRRFNKGGWKVTFCPEGQATHFGGASSAKAPLRFVVEMVKANQKYWVKHHGCRKAFIYGMFIVLRNVLRIVPSLLGCLFGGRRREEYSLKLKQNIACIQWLLNLKRSF